MGIPKYERQVKEAPIPGVMAPMGAPAAAFGLGDPSERAFEGLTQEATKILVDKAKEAKDEIDMGAVSGAAAELSKLQTSLLHDPNTGALNQLGENSFGTYEPTMGDLKKGAANIEGRLTTPEQKAAFRRHADAKIGEADQSLQVHISGQRKEYVAKNFVTAADEYANAAEANALTNPQATKANILLQQGELIKLARLKGLSDDAARAFIADETSKTHARVINLMLARDQDQTARVYYDSLPPGTIRNQEGVEVVRALELGSLRGNAQRETFRIFSPKLDFQVNQDGIVTSRKEPTEQDTYDAVDKIKDPKLQDEVRKRVRERWDDKKRVRKDEEFDDIAKASDYIAKAAADAPKSKLGARLISMDAIPPELLAKIPYRSRTALQGYVDELRKGNLPQPNGNQYVALRLLAAKDPQAFLKENPYLYRFEMTDPEFKEMLGHRESIIKGDGKAMEKLKGFLSLDEMANNKLAAKYITEWPNKEAFKRVLNEDYITFKSGHRGEEPDQYQMDKMVSELLVNKSRWYKPWSWFGAKYGFEDAEEVYSQVNKIPPGEVKAIEAALRSRNESPTRERILDLYFENNKDSEEVKKMLRRR